MKISFAKKQETTPASSTLSKMTFEEKTLLLDELEIQLLRDGRAELSLSLEQFENLHPDRRWTEISCCLREENNLPEMYLAFQSEEPDWEGASKALSSNSREEA